MGTAISARPAVTSVAGVDLMVVVQSGTTSKITVTEFNQSVLRRFTSAGTAAAPGLAVGAGTVGLASTGSGATEALILSVNGAERARLSASGIATIYGGSTTSLVVGSDTTSSTLVTNATNKAGRFCVPHYTNAEEPVGALVCTSTNGTANSVFIGGGSSIVNAVTIGTLYAAANATTVTGTGMLVWTTTGIKIQSGASTAASDLLHVLTTGGSDILRCSDSTGTVGIGGAPVSGVGLTVTNTSTAARLRYDASNYVSFVVSSGGALLATITGTSARRFSFACNGASSGGVVAHVYADDLTALAAGVGAGLTLRGVINAGATQSEMASVKAYKENATDSETGAHLDCYSRTNGSNLAANLRVCAAGNVLVRSTTTTQTAGASAQLQVDSTTRGFLPPRMTEAERDAIGTPAAGLIVYNTTTNLLNFYNGSAWGAI